MYKDAWGVRPRWIDTSNWTMEKFLDELNELYSIILENRELEKAEEARNVAKFEERIKATICMGAKNRKEAIAWIMQAEETEDTEYLCYTLGIPYGYIPK